MRKIKRRISPVTKKKLRRRAVGMQQTARNVMRLTLKTLLVISLVTLSAAGAHAGYVAATERDYFDVTTVTIEGLQSLTPPTIEKLLGPVLGHNTFELDLAAMGRRVENHRRVKTVVIYRALPNKLTIRLVERVPAAIVKNRDDHNAVWFVDRAGMFLDPVSPKESWTLPFVAGVASPTGGIDGSRLDSAFIAIDNLRGYFLLGRSPLSGVAVSGSGVLTLYFEGTDTVALAPGLPWGDEAVRLKTVDAILRKKGLTVKTINLLFADRVIVTGAEAEEKVERS